ncbi:hypothetical protein LK996_04085 [Lysobacter sp. A6]|uniref:Uncharacterized protein n=1 Tax=Noviluteimonas lactosilytica TaxID=2888523 RepID=A0ABS8JFC2_9GAMM|nr:hypothetical protein [Lysobacter lactosilyticus]MCC8362252.1 hypothetical protein [Lysobacter lactosilyticus]
MYAVPGLFDYGYIGEYFALGWRGGGELPTFIQFAAIGLTAIVAVAVFAVRGLKRRKSRPA